MVASLVGSLMDLVRRDNLSVIRRLLDVRAVMRFDHHSGLGCVCSGGVFRRPIVWEADSLSMDLIWLWISVAVMSGGMCEAL